MARIESPALLALDGNFPGMHAALDRLAGQARLHVCTARQHRQPVLDQLDRLRLLPYFTTVMVTEQSGDKDTLIARHVPDLSAQDWMLGDTGKDVQVGKALGARVVAVVGSAAKADVARAAGADVVVDRSAGDLVVALKEAVGRSGAHVVFDPVGGAAYEASTKIVAFEGRIVVVGFTSGTIPAPALNHALVKNYSIVGLHWGLYLQRDHAVAAGAHAQLTKWATSGIINPVVSQQVRFEDAASALTRLGAGESTGRIVVLGP